MSSTISKPDQTDICFLVPGDKGGGVIWVADSLCRQARAEGFRVKLLTMEPLSEATMARVDYPVECLNETPPYTDTPANFVRWVEKNKPDFLFLNNCHTMDDCIPYLPQEVRCVYVVHDTR